MAMGHISKFFLSFHVAKTAAGETALWRNRPTNDSGISLPIVVGCHRETLQGKLSIKGSASGKESSCAGHNDDS